MLYQHKEEIESKAGCPLNWNRIDNKKAAGLSVDIPGLDFDKQENYPELMNQIIDYVLNLQAEFKPYIA